MKLKYTGFIKLLICMIIILAGEVSSIWCYQKSLFEPIIIIWLAVVCFINFVAKYRRSDWV